MRKLVLVLVAVSAGLIVASGIKAGRGADNGGFRFNPNSLVLSKSIYAGNAGTVVIGETLPPGCAGGPNGSSNVQVPTTAGGVVIVAVPCGIASDNGEYPNLNDDHNVWNNSGTDGSFGISSPIYLENLTTQGHLLGT